MSRQVFRPLALRDVVVCLQDREGLTVLIALQRPAARHDGLTAIRFGVEELTFPAAIPQQVRLDPLDRRRKDGLRQVVRDFADRLRCLPPVELLGGPVPVGDDVGHVAHEHGIVREVEQARPLLQRGFGVFAVRDVDHDPPQLRGASVVHHHRHEVVQPYDASVRRDHPVFEIVVAVLARCPFAERHRPLAIMWVKVVLPECRLGEPALHRIAEDALGLVAHERELKGGGVRFPHDALDRVDQVPKASRSLAYSLLQAIAGARQRILRLAARRAHRRHEQRHYREDDQTRELGDVQVQ